jgi:hypothetical protein
MIKRPVSVKLGALYVEAHISFTNATASAEQLTLEVGRTSRKISHGIVTVISSINLTWWEEAQQTMINNLMGGSKYCPQRFESTPAQYTRCHPAKLSAEYTHQQNMTTDHL